MYICKRKSITSGIYGHAKFVSVDCTLGIIFHDYKALISIKLSILKFENNAIIYMEAKVRAANMLLFSARLQIAVYVIYNAPYNMRYIFAYLSKFVTR